MKLRRVVERARLSGRLRSFFILVAILLGALLVGGIAIAGLGESPLQALTKLIEGAFGSKNAIANTMVKACPLLFVALGTCIAFRGGVFNIGGEGQLVMGGLAAAAVGLAIPTWPIWIVILSCLAAGGAAGAAWAGIAGWLKARFNVSEILSTIMLNYIATFVMVYLLSGPMNDPAHSISGRFMPETARVVADLPRLVPTRLHLGVAIGVLLAVVVYILLWRTTVGYRIRVVGKNLRAGRAAGIHTKRYAVFAIVLSGALIGLGGAVELIGVQHRLVTEGSAVYFTGSAGFNGIVVALFGQLHPLGAIPASFLFGALLTGAGVMQRSLQIPASLVGALTGLVALLVVGTEVLRRRRAVMRDEPSPAGECIGPKGDDG